MTMDKRISRQYLEDCARGTRWLLEQGFTPSGDSGDVSLRDPNTGLIYISGFMKGIPFPYVDFNDFRAQDMAVFELDGTKISDWNDGTCETPMHLAIYRARPDVNCVVHSHPLWASMWGIAREDIPFCLGEQYGNIGGEICVAEYAPAGSWEIADNVVKALGDKSAAIMANHGAVTVGESMEVAFRYSHFMENIAQKVLFAKMLGEAHTIRPEEVLADKAMDGTIF